MKLTIIAILTLVLFSCNYSTNKKSTDQERLENNIQHVPKLDSLKKISPLLERDNDLSGGLIFSGTSTELYNCTFRINKDKTINFVYDIDKNGIYAEHTGTIKKINDTMYHVKATMTIGQFYMKSYHRDTLYISIDSTVAKELDKISVDFSNNTQKHFSVYDKNGEPISLLKIPIDKRVFNNRKGTNTVKITINRKNILTDNFLTFEIPYGSASSFTKGDKQDFYVVIKNDQLNSIKIAPIQTGHFKLKKK